MPVKTLEVDLDELKERKGANKSGPEEDYLQTTLRKLEAALNKLITDAAEPDIENELQDIKSKCFKNHPTAFATSASTSKTDITKTWESADFRHVFNVLADAVRETRWREAFGSSFQLGPDSVLLIATELLLKDGVSFEFGRDPVLRFLANCCADNNKNRLCVLKQGVLQRLIELLDPSQRPDYIVVAIYNICLGFEDPEGGKETTPTQLNTAEKLLARARGIHGQGSIEVLADVFFRVPTERRDQVVELIEIACRALPEACGLLDDSLDLMTIDKFPQSKLFSDACRTLLKSRGLDMALASVECCLTVCTAILQLLSTNATRQEAAKSVSMNWLVDFSGCVGKHLEAVASSDWSSDEPGGEELETCRSQLLRLAYDVTATDVWVQYHPMSETEATFREDFQAGDVVRLRYSLAMLVNSVRTGSDATHIWDHNSQIVLRCLQESNDPDILFPAVGLLGKMFAATENPNFLHDSNLLPSVRRILEISTTVRIKHDIVFMLRLAIKRPPHTAGHALASSETPLVNQHSSELPQTLHSALALFQNTPDGSTKLEVGRLIIEVCRGLFSEKMYAGSVFNEIVLKDQRQTAVDTVAFVARHGHEDAKSEGWFGLAMLSTWAETKSLVIDTLEKEDMIQCLEKVMAARKGPSFENARLMLVKLLETETTVMNPAIRAQLEAFTLTAGLVPPGQSQIAAEVVSPAPNETKTDI